MGMVATLEQISPRKLDGFIRIPPRAYRWTLESSVNAAHLMGFLRMAGEHFKSMSPEDKAHMDSLAAQLPAESPFPRSKRDTEHLKRFARSLAAGNVRSRPIPKRFSLEKDWHVLHYALNRTAEADESPLGACILGGSPIPDLQQVMSFGPIRYLTFERVRDIALELGKVSSDTILAGANPEAAKSSRIYLSDTLGDEEYRNYIPELFTAFRAFYAEASKHKRAMMLWIS